LNSVSASPHHTLPPPQSASTSAGGSGAGPAVKLACDRHLLAATHNSISVGPVLGVLKAILVLADRVPADAKVHPFIRTTVRWLILPFFFSSHYFFLSQPPSFNPLLSKRDSRPTFEGLLVFQLKLRSNMKDVPYRSIET